MNPLGVAAYGAAGLAFMVLAALLIISWEGRQVGARLIAASALTAVWGFVLAAESRFGGVPAQLVYLAEVARASAWLLVLTGLAAAAVPRLLIVGAHALWLGFLLLGLVASLLPRFPIDISALFAPLSLAALGLALTGLVLLEQIYRNSAHSARLTLRYFVIGVGGMFVYDLFLFSQMELASGISADAWNARGIVYSFAVPMIALAARSNPQWSLDIFVSRQVVFYTATFVGVGAFLAVMTLGGYVIRKLGGGWGVTGEMLLLASAGVTLVVLVMSVGLRRRAAVFISKHFYSNKYDYRTEWLRFIQTLSTSEEDIRRTSVRAVAQIFSSPGGVLFTRDEQGRRFVPATGWPIQVDSVAGIAPVSVNSELVRFIREKQWIIDLHEYRRVPDAYQNIGLPGWLRANPTLRIVSPIFELDRLTGFFVLYDPPPPFELTYEDRDLLNTVGRHVATQLAQRDADRKLAESRQFEAYNRLTAFMMHDLKNSVAQLELIVANAERHKSKPEFMDDAVGTIANAVNRMNHLVDQINKAPTSARTQVIRLDELIAGAVARCSLRRPVPLLQREDGSAICVRGDSERLSAVLEHVIRNAQDAAPDGEVSVRVSEKGGEAVIVVTDTGQGMDPEFVRERLFRPFDSTKGFKGMGIGAYQTREYVQMLGGHVDVQSAPGKGTSFSITLPAERSATPESDAGRLVVNAHTDS